jgi:hypothetical protein
MSDFLSSMVSLTHSDVGLNNGLNLGSLRLFEILRENKVNVGD